MLAQVRSALASSRLSHTHLTASDENDMNTALKTWKQLGDETCAAISKINVHGYSGLAPYRGRGRTALRNALGERRIWMSEYCDKDTSGLALAQSIMLDINELRANGWVYWQAVDQGPWGLMEGNPREKRLLQVNRKWFVLAHFSRHFPAGCKFLHTANPDIVAAWRPADRVIVVCYLNLAESQPTTVQLLGRKIHGKTRGWLTSLTSTNASADSIYSPVDPVITTDSVQLRAPAQSIVTLEIATL